MNQFAVILSTILRVLTSVITVVPDESIITGNVKEQLPNQVTKQGVFSLKNHFVAISIFVHVILSILLFFLAQKQQPIQIKITNKAINSYLYKKPKNSAETVLSVVKQTVVKQNSVKEISSVVEAKKHPVKTNQATVAVEKNKKSQSVTQASSQPSVKSDTKQTANLLKNSKPVKNSKERLLVETTLPETFSSFSQLQNLRKSIKEKQISQALEERHVSRSLSVMDGAQIPVPHSKKQISPEQIKEKNTMKMSGSISITKNDNGTCIIEREQFLGSPVEASTSFFSCGESKFDKSFREHMKKVQDKIVPKR